MPLKYSGPVGNHIITAEVYDRADGSAVVHIYQDGKHTGNAYPADNREARDELVRIALGL